MDSVRGHSAVSAAGRLVLPRYPNLTGHLTLTRHSNSEVARTDAAGRHIPRATGVPIGWAIRLKVPQP